MHIQTKLLRVLQEGEIQRVRGTETITVDSRVVAATNRDLTAMIGSGQFREDLFYRLNVFPIHVPPLRERMDDLPDLVDFFLKKHAGLAGNRVTKFAPAVLPAMMNYKWRGNVNQIAKLMNIDRKTVYRKMGEYQIDPDSFRE